MNSSNIRGALLSLLAFGIFATHDVVVKHLGATYEPFQIIFFSVLMGFPLATIMLMRDAAPGTLRPVHPWWTVLRTAAVVVTGFSAFYAFSVLPLAQTYAILFATPLLITLLSIPILGESVRLRRWIAVIVGLGGVMIVLRPGSAELGLGHLAGLAAAICSALASIIVRKIGQEERSMVLMLYPMVANFLVMGCLLPFVYKPMPLADMGAAGLIAILAFVATICIIAAYRSGEAVIVAPMQYSQLLWALGYGYFFFGEVPDRMTFLGAAVIIGSGLYIVLRESVRDASENTPVLRTRSRLETGMMPRISVLLRMSERSK